MEDGVEPDVLKVSDLFQFADVVAIALPQSEDRTARAECLLPEVRKRRARSAGIDVDRNRGLSKGVNGQSEEEEGSTKSL